MSARLTVRRLILLAALAMAASTARAGDSMDSDPSGADDTPGVNSLQTAHRGKSQADHTSTTRPQRAETVRSLTKKSNGNTNSANSFVEATKPLPHTSTTERKTPRNVKNTTLDAGRTKFDPKTKTWVTVPTKNSKRTASTDGQTKPADYPTSADPNAGFENVTPNHDDNPFVHIPVNPGFKNAGSTNSFNGSLTR